MDDGMITNLKQYWLKYVLCLIYGIIILIVNNSIQGVWNAVVVYANGAFIAGASLLCYGGLSICSLFGAYDIFTYMGARRNERGVKPSLYEYSQMKKEKRKEKKLAFVPYFVVGGFYLIVMIILNCVL